MSDPERLLRNPGSPLARLLLRASMEEKPSAAALRRTEKAAAAALITGAAAKGASAAAMSGGAKVAAGAAPGLAGGAAAASGSLAPPGSLLALGTLAKWFGLGALGGAIVAPVMHLALPASSAPPSVHQQSVSSPAMPRPVERARLAAASPRLVPEVVASAVASEPVVPPRTEAPRSPTAGTVASEPGILEAPPRSPSALLAAEVHLVDQGRAALKRGALTEALTLLAPYEDRFPRQQLLTEVLFLRMEAYSQAGDTTRARALASRVLTRGIAGPQAARAREVLGR